MASSTLSRRVFAALALVCFAAPLSAAAASATHVRPKGAAPLRVSLVPGQQRCTSPNAQHEPPLEHVRSCLPPLQTASAATVGTPDANGFPAQSEASVRINVINALTVDEDDRVVVEITDVRELGAPANDYNPNPTGPDMTLLARSRPVDNDDGADAAAYGPSQHRTGTGRRSRHHGRLRLPDTRRLQLHAPGIGSTCAVTTSFNAILPGFVKFDPASPNRNRQAIEIGQVQVYDSGVDKVRGTNDDTLFAVQGIWNP